MSDAFTALDAVFGKRPPDEEPFTEYTTADLIDYLCDRGIRESDARDLMRELQPRFGDGCKGRLYVSGERWHEYAAGRRKAVKRAPKQEARDKWLYQQLLNVEKPLRAVVSELKEMCPVRGWEPIESIQGVRTAANKYAKRHGKPPPPRRQDL